MRKLAILHEQGFFTKLMIMSSFQLFFELVYSNGFLMMKGTFLSNVF